MTLIDAAVVTTLGIQLLTLGGLWLRLRWQAKHQKGHRSYIESLARILPAGSRIDDLHDAGRRTHLMIGPATEAHP